MMEKSKRLTKKQLNSRKSYNVEMIKDFLENLMWDLRIQHFEVTHSGGTRDAEFDEHVEKYMKKYKSVGLLSLNILPNSVDKYSGEVVKKLIALKYQQAIDNLEELGDIFEEACNCASHEDTFLTRKWTPEQIKRAVKAMEEMEEEEE